MTKRRTNTDRNIDTVHQLKERIRDIFRRARTRQLSHAEILSARTSEIFSHSRWKYLTRADVELLRGYFEAMSDRQWDEVVWTLKDSATDTIVTDNYRQLSKDSRLIGAHVYRSAPHKPYTAWAKV